MNIYENVIDCMEVEDITATVRQFEELGCSLKTPEMERCATLVCSSNELRVCEKREGDPACQLAATTA